MILIYYRIASQNRKSPKSLLPRNLDKLTIEHIRREARERAPMSRMSRNVQASQLADNQ